uniref:Fibrinogen alpha/beta/gamma chain coiled coil domain-containing protein n=1 Tax=Nothobranchius furzeri TaxID=105023 RepID=A0A8C6KPI5_NOTFU
MSLLVCLVCVAVTQVASQVDPRGARPVEPATRSDKCSTQKEWPFCTDDDWLSKCPSGCRIQGLMDKADHELLKKIEKIRSLLNQNKAKHRSTDQVSKQTYDYLRDRLTTDSGNNNNYYDLAQSLRQRITDMKIRIDNQMNTLAALKNRVKNQVTEMQRLEVDIDIKLRSCKGSCGGYSEYQVDKESYVNLDKQMRQLEAQSAQSVESVGTLYVMKTSSLQTAAAETRFKSKDVGGQKKDDVFSEVKTLQFVLEQEGSSSSPATVSKEPVCLRFMQQKQDGRPTPSSTAINRFRCSEESHVPLCLDDDWTSKCPSGCRLQGLISQAEVEVERKLQTVCRRMTRFKATAEESMLAVTVVYGTVRRALLSRYMSERKFADHAHTLSRNLTSLRKRSNILAQNIKEMNTRVRKQLEEMYRTEVDVDMKLRSCRGSCHSALQLNVKHQDLQTLQTDLNFLDETLNQKPAAPPPNIPQVKLQLRAVYPLKNVKHKTFPMVQLTQFEDVELNNLELGEQTESVNTEKPEGGSEI